MIIEIIIRNKDAPFRNITMERVMPDLDDDLYNIKETQKLCDFGARISACLRSACLREDV